MILALALALALGICPHPPPPALRVDVRFEGDPFGVQYVAALRAFG